MITIAKDLLTEPKENKPIELVGCFQDTTSENNPKPFFLMGNGNSLTNGYYVSLARVAKVENNKVLYDVIIGTKASGVMEMWLGHWNSGNVN